MDINLRKSLKPLSFLLFLLSSLCFSSLVRAADISATNLPNVDTFIGEQSCTTTILSNSGAPGYGPYVIISVSENLLLDSVSLFSGSLTQTLLGVIGANGVTDPISSTEFLMPLGASVYQLILPVGSVVENGPPLELEICTTLANGIAIGDIQTVSVAPGYQFGDTPTGDNGPIFDYPANEVTGDINPVVEVLEKTSTAPEGERPPGPSFPFEFLLSSDIANGETITDITLIDILDPAFQWTGDPVQIVAANSINCTVVMSPNQEPISGGTVEAHCDAVTGSLSEVDLQVIIPVYIIDILDESAQNPQQILHNHVDMVYSFDNVEYMDAGDVDVIAKAFAMQKSASPEYVLPGSDANYTINFQYTDYPVSGNSTTKLEITDVLPDGLAYILGSANITLNSVSQGVVNPVETAGPLLGESSLFWDIQALQSQANGTVGSISFLAKVAHIYQDGRPVLARDRLVNTVSAVWELGNGGSGSDGSSATVYIVNSDLTKSIFFPDPLPEFLYPGDQVIFRLQQSIPAGNVNALVLTDYLPLPVFDVASFDINNDWSVTSTGNIAQPTVQVGLATNSVEFDFGDIDESLALIITTELSLTITDTPFADQLSLTNIAISTFLNSEGEQDLLIDTVPIMVGAPSLEIYKGVWTSDNPGANIAPAPPASPSQSPVLGDVSGVDANDIINFVITVENTGHAPAYQVTITDPDVQDLSCSLSGDVKYGNGTIIPGSDYTLVPDGIRLNVPLLATDGTPGQSFSTDTVLVNFTCTLSAAVQYAQEIVNTGHVAWAATATATTFFPELSAISTLTTASPTLEKSVIEIYPGYTSASPYSSIAERGVSIGERVRWQVLITLPEGQMNNVNFQDTLDDGLAFVEGSLSITPVGLVSSTIAGSFMGALSNSAYLNPGASPHEVEQQLAIGPLLNDFGLGDIANADSDNNAVETLLFTYDTIVLNWTSNIQNNTRKNSAKLFWDAPVSGRSSLSTIGPIVKILEPKISILKTLSSNIGDAGDTFQVSLLVKQLSNAPAFQFALEDQLPAELIYNAGTFAVGACTEQPDSLLDNAGLMTASWSEFPIGASCELIFDVTVAENVGAGAIIQNCATTFWQSLNDADQVYAMGNNPLAAERTGDITDQGTVANIYTSESCADFKVLDVGIAKAITTTSQDHTGTNQHQAGVPDLTIGEEVTYEIITTLPEGVVSQLIITDTVPFGTAVMELLTATVSQVGNNITLSGPVPTAIITDTHLGDGVNDTAVFDFGIDVRDDSNNLPPNDDDRVFITITARVKDLPVNQDGNSATNHVLVQFGPGLDGGASAPADVVEPQLLVSKNVNNTQAEAGQPLLYSLVIQHAPASTADAFFVMLEDTLPTGLNFSGFIGLGVCPTPPDSGPVESGGVITASWDSLPLNASCEITFTATLDINVAPGQQVINQVDAQWLSLDNAALPDIRSYNDSAEIAVVATAPGVEKGLFSTNNVDTSNGEKGPSEDLTIGETIVYEIVVTFEDGTAQDVVIRDLLPTNLAILEYVSSSVYSVGDDLTINGLNVGDSGDDCLPACDQNNDSLRDMAQWNLSTVVNEIDSVVGENPDDQLVFHVTAIVTDVVTNSGIPGDSENQSNLAEIRLPDSVISSLYNVDIVAPLLEIDKTALPQNGQIVDGSAANIVYKIDIRHTPDSTADAYNVLVADNLNLNTFWVNDATVNTDCPGFSIKSAPAIGSTGLVEFEILQLPKQTIECSISYEVDVNDALPIAGVFINQATLSWFSMPPSPLSPLPSGRQGTGSSEGSFISVAGAGITKEVVATTLGETGQGQGNDLGDNFLNDLTIGEVAVYHVVMSFNEGTTQNVVLTDDSQFDPSLGKMEILAASVISIGADISTTLPGTVIGAPGSSILLDFGTVSNSADVLGQLNDTITVEIVGRMQDLPENSNDKNSLNNAELEFEDGLTRNDTAQVNTVLPVLEMTKLMLPPIDNRVEVVLQLKNTGTAPAYDLLITDPFDEVVYVASSAVAVLTPPGFAFSQTSAGGDTTVEFKLNGNPLLPSAEQILMPGETLELRFMITVLGGSQPESIELINTANTDYSSLPGEFPFEASYQVDASDTLSLPFLSQTKVWNGTNNPALPGDQISFTIEVSNSGNSGVSDLFITDTPDPLGQFVAGSVVASAGGVVIVGNSLGDTYIEVEYASLAAGATAELSYLVDIDNPWPAQPQKLTNQATVDTKELIAGVTDWPVAPGTTDPTIVGIVADPILVLVKTDHDVEVEPGDPLVFELSYENTGNQNTTGVVINEVVPLYTTFNAANSSPTVWSCPNGAAAGTLCQTTIGNLIVANPGVVLFGLQVNSSVPTMVDTVTNTAVITDNGQQSDNGLPVVAEATDTTPIIVTPGIAVSKSDGDKSVAPGDLFAYTIDFSNTGNQDLTGVVLTETVPPYTFFNASVSTAGWSCAPGSPAGTVCLYTVGNLAGGTSGTVDFGLKVLLPIPSGVDMTENLVLIRDDGNNNSGVVLTDEGTDTTPIVGSFAISIIKDDGGVGTVQPGDQIDYNLSWTVNGSQHPENVVVTETVPEGTLFSAAGSLPDVWSCPDNAIAGSVCTQSLGALTVGSSGSLNFAVVVDNPLPLGQTTVKNTVKISGGGSSTVVTPIEVAPPVGRKRGHFDIENQAINWEMVWFNPDNKAPLPVFILDEIPEGLAFSRVNCVADGNSVCSARFNVLLNRIEVTGIIAQDSQAVENSTAEQLLNEIVITLVTTIEQTGAVEHLNTGAACWDENNSGSAQDDFEKGQSCIEVTGSIIIDELLKRGRKSGTDGPATPGSENAIPTLATWSKLLTIIMLLIIGMLVLNSRQQRW